ncbi:hypothetical protein EPA93_47625 [Ktedonosporobacter rubrisoli]|uniref:Uncharacterized protein n=1 Tax=Ktedonosporobacter rubrisoli TaxID=2509675 RepID=A0A4P6K5S3_KTERU|nr:hypothetical protein [Ktedonosporobacter rubrisoli]QBD83230.1 hypothetical protein EPA93_47625 [Ktedonosporobacter rubrisoli]
MSMPSHPEKSPFSLKKDMSQRLANQTASPPSIAINGLGTMSGRRGVPLSVPLPFLLTGSCAAALFGILFPLVAPQAMLAPGFPHVLAMVHTVTLGWLTMAIMGASLQLTPVIVVAPLRATRFLRWHYPIYVTGVILLLCGFWFMLPWLMISGGSLVVLAVIHYVIIMGSTLAHATTRPLTTSYLTASLVYLSIVVCLGLTAALNFQFNFLDWGLDQLVLTHITLGVLGWLTNTLIGVSYTLVRLFALVHGNDERRGQRIFILLNVSIVLLVLGFISSWQEIIILGGIILVAAVWLFAYDYVCMLRLRKRKVLDVTQYHSIAAVVYLGLMLPGAILIESMGWNAPRILAALALGILLGWLGQSIVGYLYKIVPFLVWHARYGSEVGRKKVPLMRELVHERWAWLSWWLINLGLPLAILAALLSWVLPLQIACALFGIGLILAAINVAGIVSHLRPLPSSASLKQEASTP